MSRPENWVHNRPQNGEQKIDPAAVENHRNPGACLLLGSGQARTRAANETGDLDRASQRMREALDDADLREESKTFDTRFQNPSGERSTQHKIKEF
jgi:hypothetical protein